MVGTFRVSLFLKAFLAGTFNKIAYFEIIFIFEIFFCHSVPGLACGIKRSIGFLNVLFALNNNLNQKFFNSVRPISKVPFLSQYMISHKLKTFLEIDNIRPSWHTLLPLVPELDRTPL